MRENLSTRFPKTPELHPLRSIQAKIWQIVGFGLIVSGLGIMGWGGWTFYQQQAELYNPPAPILEVPANENLEILPSQPAPPNIEATEPSAKANSELLPLELDQPLPPTASPAPQEVDSVQATLGDKINIQGKSPVEEAVSPSEKTVSLVEEKLREEATLTADQAADTVPSLADNPLVVVEDVPAPTEAESTAEETAALPTSPPTRIVAESISLDSPVVETGWQEVVQNGIPTNVWVVADYAAGWHKNSALPGLNGNIVLSGHHNIKGEVFRYIVNLEVGDVVNLYVGDQRYDYVVNDKFIVKDKGEPESVRRANARWIGPFNEERLTLVTCWPYNSNTHRVIVIAKPG